MSFKAKGDGKENDSSALFDVLDVQLEDGTSFSALSDKELVLKKHPTASLGKTIVLPVSIISRFKQHSRHRTYDVDFRRRAHRQCIVILLDPNHTGSSFVRA